MTVWFKDKRSLNISKLCVPNNHKTKMNMSLWGENEDPLSNESLIWIKWVHCDFKSACICFLWFISLIYHVPRKKEKSHRWECTTETSRIWVRRDFKAISCYIDHSFLLISAVTHLQAQNKLAFNTNLFLTMQVWMLYVSIYEVALL